MHYTRTLPVRAIPVKGQDQCFPVERIFCVGRNYVAHAQEMGFSGREPPFFFMKPTTSLLSLSEGEVGQLSYPPLTQDLQPEIELVVCIGKAGKKIQLAQAWHHIYGYAIGLDMTLRDVQAQQKKLGRPWEIAKSFDHSAPISQIIEAHTVADIANAAISLSVNGTVRQSSHLNELIWSIPEIIEHLSLLWELQAGDLIYTGTPAGVAAVVKGDRMVGSIAGIGELQIQVV